MAHRIVDETSLKTVADAIREKAGTSDSLVFPTGFAEAIAGIQAGGGGGGGGIASGYFIPSADLGSDCDLTITHNLGEIPKLAVVYREITAEALQDLIVSGEVALSIAVNGEIRGAGYYYSSDGYAAGIKQAVRAANSSIALSSNRAENLSGSCIHSCTTETAKLYPIKNKGKKFAAGSKYRWILMTEEAYNAL